MKKQLTASVKGTSQGKGPGQGTGEWACQKGGLAILAKLVVADLTKKVIFEQGVGTAARECGPDSPGGRGPGGLQGRQGE